MVKPISSSAVASVEGVIHTVRGERVILDSDLARLYGASTKALNQAVKRNAPRFPQSFVFRLTYAEAESMRSQIVTASKRNIRFEPYAFTEHGALMAANVLKSKQAIQMSIVIIETFVKLRRFGLSLEEFSRRLNDLERGYLKHGQHFKIVFDALRQLMSPPSKPKREIGFHVKGAA